MKSYMLILLSALSLGVVNIFYKKSTAAVGPINTTFLYYLFGTAFSAVIWYFWRESGKIEMSGLIYPALVALFLCISIVTFNLGLVHAKVSVASAMRSFAFLFSVLIAVLFLKETLTVKQIIGIVLAGGSLYMFVS